MAQNTTPAQVARHATQTTADLGADLILLGTFGRATTPSALLRARDGTVLKVTRGDSIDGQVILAIEDGRVALARNGTAHWLDMPKPAS